MTIGLLLDCTEIMKSSGCIYVQQYTYTLNELNLIWLNVAVATVLIPPVLDERVVAMLMVPVAMATAGEWTFLGETS